MIVLCLHLEEGGCSKLFPTISFEVNGGAVRENIFEDKNFSVFTSSLFSSYGGMLAAYLRFKYPNVVDGSLAASAPIYWISGYEDRHGFFKSVTEQFMKSSKDCVDRVRQGFADTARYNDKVITLFGDV